MYCPKCGNILPENSLFCDKCGCSLKQESVKTPQHTYMPRHTSYTGSTATSTKAKTWIEKLNLSAYQKTNAIISLCAAIMLLICIDGSIYMWLYLLAAVGVLVLTVKKLDYRHVLSAAVPSTILFAFIITDFVTAAARQRVQAINIIMQIILAGAVVVLWLLCVHPKYKENNKTTAILMMIGLICLAVIAIFFFISFFINLRYIGVYFRMPFGNLGNSAVIVAYLLFLFDEGKTIQWIKETLRTPTVQQWSPYQSNPVTSNSIPYNTPIENDIDDSVVCAACDYRLPKGSMFCDNCGSSLQSVSTVIENDGMDDDRSEQDMPIVDTNDTVICPTCGSEVDGDSTFCEYCGAAISFPDNIPSVNATPQYNAETDFDTDAVNDDELLSDDDDNLDAHSEEVICPKCGNVMPEVSEYCDRCGEHILLEGSDDSFAVDPASQAQSVYYQPEPQVIPKQAPPIVDERLGFLNQNEVLIDEKLSTFKFANSYRVYDLNGNNIGTVQQVDISGGAKAARVLLGKNTKGLQQFHYKILDNNGKQLAAVHRDGGAFSQIRIVDSNEKTVGYLSRGKVYSPADELLCNFKSDWKGWNLTLTDPTGNPIGEVKKKWNGLGKELFTSADKYYVSVNPSVTGNTRIAIFGTAIIYDILLHET